MSLTIPKEQKHGVDVPAMMAFYQYVKLTPMGSKSEYELQPNAYCEEIKWELSGDNIINLAKSYIQYDIEIETSPADDANAFVKNSDDTTPVASKVNNRLFPRTIKGMKEGFGIASFRICNQLGTDLVKLDDSYEPYRVFMDEIVRKRPDIFYQTNYYDGIQITWDNSVHDCVIRDENEWEMPKDGDKKVMVTGDAGSVQLYKNKLIIHVKMHLGKFYNTFAALKSDIFFGERMYICIRFQTSGNFGEIKAWNEDRAYKNGTAIDAKGNIKGAPVKMKFKNFYFYAYYNKDSQCNNNTKSYCLSKPIQFNDFRCHQVGVAPGGNGIFNYSFTLNSSNGPFVRFIIYRPWVEKDGDGKGRYAVIPENAQFRWMINDFVYQPDYSLMQYYDSYMTVQEYFKDSWYDIFRRKEDFNHKFFEILNFGSKDLDNIKNQSGRPLASDLKITFEFSAPGTDTDYYKYSVMHRFYIITGRMCTINGSGIVSVI